jgi:hypothetical protein
MTTCRLILILKIRLLYDNYCTFISTFNLAVLICSFKYNSFLSITTLILWTRRKRPSHPTTYTANVLINAMPCWIFIAMCQFEEVTSHRRLLLWWRLTKHFLGDSCSEPATIKSLMRAPFSFLIDETARTLKNSLLRNGYTVMWGYQSTYILADFLWHMFTIIHLLCCHLHVW